MQTAGDPMKSSAPWLNTNWSVFWIVPIDYKSELFHVVAWDAYNSRPQQVVKLFDAMCGI